MPGAFQHAIGSRLSTQRQLWTHTGFLSHTDTKPRVKGVSLFTDSWGAFSPLPSPVGRSHPSLKKTHMFQLDRKATDRQSMVCTHPVSTSTPSTFSFPVCTPGDFQSQALQALGHSQSPQITSDCVCALGVARHNPRCTKITHCAKAT